MKFISGYAAHADYSMKVCAHDDKNNCYKAMTVPIITYVDNHSGSAAGGQTLKIQGFGFTGPNDNSVTSVKVDGVACSITSNQIVDVSDNKEEITCVTGSKGSASTTGD